MMDEIGLDRIEKLKKNFFSESVFLYKSRLSTGSLINVDKLEMLEHLKLALTGRRLHEFLHPR
jgi:hypothetical protein